jgi:hypothetical protein
MFRRSYGWAPSRTNAFQKSALSLLVRTIKSLKYLDIKGFGQIGDQPEYFPEAPMIATLFANSGSAIGSQRRNPAPDGALPAGRPVSLRFPLDSVQILFPGLLPDT